MDRFKIPYGLEWDAENEILRCRLCYPAHTYAATPEIRNLDEWLADSNIKSFLETHEHTSGNPVQTET